ncbi:MAG: DNA primase family protein [Endozoicomonas sp.]
MAHGTPDSKGVNRFSCLTVKCDLEHGDCIDMYMHLTGQGHKDAVEQLCQDNSITIIKERYEAKKLRNGWQYWSWYDPDNILMLVKGRNKDRDIGSQQRPATEEEVKLGCALAKDLVWELDADGNKTPKEKAERDLSESEVKLGFLLKEEPAIHIRSRGKLVGKPYETKYNSYYKTHMVGCLTIRKPSWPYLANDWFHKEGPVHFVEGEKDSDVLKSMGYLSTTTGASSNKWTFEWASKFEGRDRYHYRDNDIPGAKSLLHRLKIFKDIPGKDYWVPIPDQKPLKETKGEDLRDYLKLHSDQEFTALLSNEHAQLVDDQLIAELDFEFNEASEVFKAKRKALKNSDDVITPEKIKKDPSVNEPDEEEKYDDSKEPDCRPTETGNGKRFRYRFLNTVKHVAHGFHSEWLIWTGRNWHIDRKNKKTFQLTQEVSEMIRREIARRENIIPDDAPESDPQVKYVKKLRRWADTTESVSNRRNTMESASSEPQILAEYDDFDKDLLLFNCQNGTINLRTGMFRKHNKDDLMTKCGNVHFDSRATCPKFKSFISEIMMGDEELVRYLQRLLGYSLTGLTREECMHMCVGDGQNGKGVLLELIAWIMGDYAITAEADMFLIKKSEAAASADVARLMGARLALASETNEGAKFNEAKLKSLTSRDTITARFNHKDPFEFSPTHKILLATNKLITVTGKDRGIWRRLRVIRFDNNIAHDKVDKDLQMKLRDEASGILNWLIEGFQAYQKFNGLKPPQKILDWRQEYKESMDYLQDFFETECVIQDAENVDKKDLFEAFNKWQKNTIKMRDPYNYNLFCTIMRQHNFKDGRIGKGPRFFKGIRLKTDMEREKEKQEFLKAVEEAGGEELKNQLRIEDPI